MGGAFSGAEPLVGEVVGVRTFRVDESGLLLPLYSTLAWHDGVNTAECAPPTGDRGVAHRAPDPACECGFYCYGGAEVAQRHRQAHYVEAVVSCWGSVVAGTQGVRAEHARVDAVWLHPNAPAWLRRRLVARYPSTRVYADRAVMRASHPLSALPCYSAPLPRRRLRRVAEVGGAAIVLSLGLLPMSILRDRPGLWSAWLLSVLASAVLLVATLTRGRRGAAVVAAGVLAWLAAPAAGLAGWVLRLPLLRAFVLSAARFAWSLRPGHFPVESVARERTFCGVRG